MQLIAMRDAPRLGLMTKTPAPASFGDKLRQIRQLRRLTLAQLSQLLSRRADGKPGASASYLGRLESHLSMPTAGLAQDIAEALKVEVGVLLNPRVQIEDAVRIARTGAGAQSNVPPEIASLPSEALEALAEALRPGSCALVNIVVVPDQGPPEAIAIRDGEVVYPWKPERRGTWTGGRRGKGAA